MADYSKYSPYSQTPTFGTFLDILDYRPIPIMGDDVEYTIDPFYQYRPDLLAHDLYDNASLWWVFYQRNPNTLQKPPLDFAAGTTIYVPKITTLRSVLGF